jgi:hypothetical protein
VTGPYPPESITTISPPGLVTDSAAASVRQLANAPQLTEVLTSFPVVETKVLLVPPVTAPKILNAPGPSPAKMEKTVHWPEASLTALCAGFGKISAVTQFSPFPESEGDAISQYCDPANKTGLRKEFTTTGGLFAPKVPSSLTR